MIINQRATNIYKKLTNTYPNLKSSLDFKTSSEVFAAVILSAQCTDKRVNIVTKNLFKKYRTFEDYANSDIDELKKIIHSTGFYNAKAKALKLGAKRIVEEYDSKLPSTTVKLITIPGIGKKVANVILSEWYRKNEGIAVDTHNKRLAIRIGLTSEIDIKKANTVKIETDLKKLFSKKNWNKVSLAFIEHGRQVCLARKPQCEKCVINKYCDYYNSLNK